MTDFKAKMHQIRFRLGLHPRPRWGLQRSPSPLDGFGGRFAAGEGLGWERGGKGREGEVERGGKGRAPKLLLNQGPSEHCYATGRACCSLPRTHPRSRLFRPRI